MKWPLSFRLSLLNENFKIIFPSTFILVAEEELPLLQLDLFSFSYGIAKFPNINSEFFFFACSYIESWRKYTMIADRRFISTMT